MKTLAEAFHHTLQDIYYAEQALTKALPKEADAASDVEFKALVATHLFETKQQIMLLDKVFASFGEKGAGVSAMQSTGLSKRLAALLRTQPVLPLMPVSLLRRRPWSTMRLPATERCANGPRSSAIKKRVTC